MNSDQSDEKAVLLSKQRKRLRQVKWAGIVLALLLLGNMIIYNVGGGESKSRSSQFPYISTSEGNAHNPPSMDYEALAKQVNPPDGYKLPAKYGDLGPRLLAAGVIDYDTFAAIYEIAGNPLTPTQEEILNQGSDAPIIINQADAHFLLNLFWAVGLANRNKILTEGLIVTQSNGKIESFASTGGWSLATRPLNELYANLDLIPLTPEQQSRVEEVASAVYRPCCDNATIFPDCNHGMAMLGLLELMASQGASVDEMFNAAKYINAFWFPQQALESAIYLKASQDIDFANASPRLLVGRDMSSASGAVKVHQSLNDSGLLIKAPGQANSCSN